MPVPPAITLRPFQETDGVFFAGLAADERVTRFVGDGQPWAPQAVETRVRAALRQDPVEQVGAARWFLAEEGTRPVGVVVSTRRDEGVEIGYWVAVDHWGRGVAGAMVDRALATIPKVYGTRTLLARVHPANTASARLLTRRGFRLGSIEGGLEHYVLMQAQ